MSPHQASSGSVKTTAGNRPRLVGHLVAGDGFDGDLGLVGRLVREHRLAGDVADRVERRLGGASLRVDADEALRVDLRPSCFSSRGRWPFGRRPIDTSTFSKTFSLVVPSPRFEVDRHAVGRPRSSWRPSCSSITVSQIVVDALGQDLDEIAIGAGQQARQHLDDRDLRCRARRRPSRARGRCSRRRSRAATSARSCRSSAVVESSRRLGADRQIRQRRRPRAGGEDADVEGDRLLAAGRQRHRHALRIDDGRAALHVADLARACVSSRCRRSSSRRRRP